MHSSQDPFVVHAKHQLLSHGHINAVNLVRFSDCLLLGTDWTTAEKLTNDKKFILQQHFISATSVIYAFPTHAISMSHLSLHFTEKDEIYLTFKTMNESKTGSLAMQEFYNIYHIAGLSWKVRFSNVISYMWMFVFEVSLFWFMLKIVSHSIFFLCKRGSGM